MRPYNTMIGRPAEAACRTKLHYLAEVLPYATLPDTLQRATTLTSSVLLVFFFGLSSPEDGSLKSMSGITSFLRSGPRENVRPDKMRRNKAKNTRRYSLEYRRNKKAIELHLTNLIAKMTRESGLHPDEWDIDRILLAALKGLPAKRSSAMRRLKANGRDLLMLADHLKVSINPKYQGFVAS